MDPWVTPPDKRTSNGHAKVSAVPTGSGKLFFDLYHRCHTRQGTEAPRQAARGMLPELSALSIEADELFGTSGRPKANQYIDEYYKRLAREAREKAKAIEKERVDREKAQKQLVKNAAREAARDAARDAAQQAKEDDLVAYELRRENDAAKTLMLTHTEVLDMLKQEFEPIFQDLQAKSNLDPLEVARETGLETKRLDEYIASLKRTLAENAAHRKELVRKGKALDDEGKRDSDEFEQLDNQYWAAKRSAEIFQKELDEEVASKENFDAYLLKTRPDIAVSTLFFLNDYAGELPKQQDDFVTKRSKEVWTALSLLYDAPPIEHLYERMSVDVAVNYIDRGSVKLMLSPDWSDFQDFRTWFLGLVPPQRRISASGPDRANLNVRLKGRGGGKVVLAALALDLAAHKIDKELAEVYVQFPTAPEPPEAPPAPPAPEAPEAVDLVDPQGPPMPPMPQMPQMPQMPPGERAKTVGEIYKLYLDYTDPDPEMREAMDEDLKRAPDNDERIMMMLQVLSEDADEWEKEIDPVVLAKFYAAR